MSGSSVIQQDLLNNFFPEESEKKHTVVRNSPIRQRHGKKHEKLHANEKANYKGRPGNHKPQSKPLVRSSPGNHDSKINRSPNDTEHKRL